MSKLEDVDLLAWVGEDERGSGKIGLKMGMVPAGLIPIVAVAEHQAKITTPDLLRQFQRQADACGKVIRLVRYVPIEEVIVLRPNR